MKNVYLQNTVLYNFPVSGGTRTRLSCIVGTMEQIVNIVLNNIKSVVYLMMGVIVTFKQFSGCIYYVLPGFYFSLNDFTGEYLTERGISIFTLVIVCRISLVKSYDRDLFSHSGFVLRKVGSGFRFNRLLHSLYRQMFSFFQHTVTRYYHTALIGHLECCFVKLLFFVNRFGIRQKKLHEIAFRFTPASEIIRLYL